MRLIVIRLKPVAFAMLRTLQCVASGGVLSSVRMITCSTASSVIAGRPRPRLVEQPVEPSGHKARAPLADRGGRNPPVPIMTETTSVER